MNQKGLARKENGKEKTYSNMYSSLSCFLETCLHRYSKSMISGEYKTVLNELFDVLQLSEESRERAIIIFKHKLAGTLLQHIQNKIHLGELV